MGLKCGIVGLPNVGKSTLFNAITASQIPAENYPFCTIEPHVGIVAVPDPRLDQLALLVKPQATVPTTLELVDIAGLVKGAADGEGLGNKFLSHIRETDAISHVVRAFDNGDILHVSNRVDPRDDAAVINLELIMADLQSVENIVQRLSKKAKSADKSILEEKNLLERAMVHLQAGKPLRSLLPDLGDVEASILRSYQFITTKPMLYVMNMSENPQSSDEQHVERMSAFAREEGTPYIPICAQLEAEIAQLSPADQQVFLADLNWEAPGLHRLIQAAYGLLHLHTYFTAGVKEVRAWTVAQGASAPQAAGVIHSDFEKGFIRAEVIHYPDFIAHGGESGAKEAGKWRLEGKEYTIQDGDVVHFRFNV